MSSKAFHWAMFFTSCTFSANVQDEVSHGLILVKAGIDLTDVPSNADELRLETPLGMGRRIDPGFRS